MPVLPVLKLGSVGPYVRRLQINLNGLSLNYNNFTINGVFDIKTRNVVQNFQDRFELKRDGIVGPNTWSVLIENVKLVQRQLTLRGYNSGYADGWIGPITINAVKRFQRDNKLYQDGIVNPRTRQRLFNPSPKINFEYMPSSNSIKSLNPRVAVLAQKFLDLTIANNLDVRITNAFRSWNEQDRLYAQGRTMPGSLVTNAQGGDSYHNWGLAFDASPYENGKISNDIEKYKKMGQLGQQVGLEWGGTFISIVDLPHFQYTFGLNTWSLLNGIRPPS
ncbi:peptidoglycan-binding protein [Clostridium psychrophilum]|uniref:peptidoglycan-binding protein n=1 Tax=Clostridium psychrophilum TaxID=132926 RepID=UPI001C0C3D48|nr:peptidoglycan-binding protein [Clostridium psychrophilum]MBU3180295.1 peptidoglycan-binding protein [Clostridium psychrophilum]